MLKTVSGGWSTEGFPTPKDNFFDYVFVAKHMEKILEDIKNGKDAPEYFDREIGLCGNFRKVGEALGTKKLSNLGDSFLPESFIAMGLDPEFPLGYEEVATDMYRGRGLQKRIALLGGLLDLWEKMVVGEDKTCFVENTLDRYMDHALEFWEDKGLVVDYHQILPTEEGISLTIVFNLSSRNSTSKRILRSFGRLVVDG